MIWILSLSLFLLAATRLPSSTSWAQLICVWVWIISANPPTGDRISFTSSPLILGVFTRPRWVWVSCLLQVSSWDEKTLFRAIRLQGFDPYNRFRRYLTSMRTKFEVDSFVVSLVMRKSALLTAHEYLICYCWIFGSVQLGPSLFSQLSLSVLIFLIE